MTNNEIRTEVAKQINDTLVLLVAALRDEATRGGPPSRQVLERAAEAVQSVVNNQRS
jgi:hypothetical protein